MTRAKDELVLCGTYDNRLVVETGVEVQPAPRLKKARLPQQILYRDLGVDDVWISKRDTRQRQHLIKSLREGAALQLRPRRYRSSTSGDKDRQGWLICDARGMVLGALSRKGDRELAEQGLGPDRFEFQDGEVRVGRIYHHLQFHEITGQKMEDWFVIVPQIRVCR
jgi:ATP-dependent DNA helicase RecQ